MGGGELYIREILQGAGDTHVVFEEYIAALEASQDLGTGVAVTATTSVRADGRDCVVIADDQGYFRHVTLDDASFRLFAVMQAGGRMPWRPRGLLGGDDDIIEAVHGAHINAVAFIPSDASMVMAFTHTPCVFHTGYVGEEGWEFNVYPLGRCRRAVRCVAASDAFIAAGDDGGDVLLWPVAARGGLEETPASHELTNLHAASVTCIAFTCEATRVVTGSMDNTVNIIEASSGVVLKRMMVETGRVTAIAPMRPPAGVPPPTTTTPLPASWVLLCNDQGTNIVVDSDGGIVRLLPALRTASVGGDGVTAAGAWASATTSTGHPPTALANHYALGTKAGRIALVDARDSSVTHSYTVPCGVAYMGFADTTTDGEMLVAVGASGGVWMWPAWKFIKVPAAAGAGLGEQQPQLQQEQQPAAPHYNGVRRVPADEHAHATAKRVVDADAVIAAARAAAGIATGHPSSPGSDDHHAAAAAPAASAFHEHDGSDEQFTDEDPLPVPRATRPVAPSAAFPRVDPTASTSAFTSRGGAADASSLTYSHSREYTACPVADEAPIGQHGGMAEGGAVGALSMDVVAADAAEDDIITVAPSCDAPVRTGRGAGRRGDLHEPKVRGGGGGGGHTTAVTAYRAPGQRAARGLLDTARLTMKNPDAIRALAAVDVTSAYGEEAARDGPAANSAEGTAADALARPEGRALEAIESQIAAAKSEAFDYTKFVAAHPNELQRQRDLNPLTDTTGYAKGARRYGQPLPGIDVASEDLEERRLVGKQVDKKWQTRQSVRPHINAIPRALRSHFPRSTHAAGGVYDCPAPTRPDAAAPLPFPTVDALVTPFVPRTPHGSTL